MSLGNRIHMRSLPRAARAAAIGLALLAPLSPAPAAEAEYDDGFNLFAPARRDEETLRALQPPGTVSAPASVPAPVADAGRPAGGIVISPPATNMPVAYYDLPVADSFFGDNLPPLAEGIPGVLLPELDDSFSEPAASSSFGRRSLAQRASGGGMSIRQLEPFFALAKGSEGRALEARRTGENAVYEDQLGKSLAAYMDIISMADAGNEAREEAWYGVARCEYRRQNWWRAFEALERSFPNSFSPDEVAGRVRLEMFIGERLWRMEDNAVPDAVVEGRPLSGYQAAAKVYEAVVFNQPNANDAPLALLRQGDAAALHHDYQEAAKHYRQLVAYYPDSEHAMQARSSLAEAIYRQEWPTGFPEAARRDVQSIMADVERTESVLSGEAATRRERAIAVANSEDAERKLRHAKGYLTSIRTRRGREAAVTLLKDVVSMYPETPQAGEARDMLLSLGVQPPAEATPVSPFAVHDPFAQLDEPRFEDVVGDSYVTLEVPTDIP